MAKISQAKKSYRVRIVASSGSSEQIIKASSTMNAYQQALAIYAPEAVLYSLSVQPYQKSSNERLVA